MRTKKHFIPSTWTILHNAVPSRPAINIAYREHFAAAKAERQMAFHATWLSLHAAIACEREGLAADPHEIAERVSRRIGMPAAVLDDRLAQKKWIVARTVADTRE